MTFGRMNPPTKGHERLVNRVKELADDGDHHIFVSGTHDARRNPLKPDQKNSYLQSSFPDTNISQQPSAFHALKKLQDDGYKDVTVVVGADRVGDFERIGSHKDFNFDKYNVVSAGERAGGEIENISASRARQAAKEKKFGEFKAMTPTLMTGKQARQMFTDIQTQMEEFGLTEEMFADQKELQLFFEAFFPMKYLFEQDSFTGQNMAMDTMQGGANLGQGNEDRDRKRLDREASRRSVESNPWPELLVVRTANDNKLRIIPKADFDQGNQEIVAGNYPGAPPMGEVTPQISFSVMQEPDFEASKTSNKLLKMFGVSDPRELDVGMMGAGGVAGGAPAPVSGAPMSPEEQMAMGMAPAPRTPPDGIEITDPMSSNPDWDHTAPELVGGVIMAWNTATGRNPMDGGVPPEVGQFINVSETLAPASERFAQSLLQEIPPEYIAYDNAGNPGQITPEWQMNGGSNPTPAADMVFLNPATNDFIRANVAVGKTNLMSKDEGEGNVIFNTMTSQGLTVPFTNLKQSKDLTSTVKSKLGQGMSDLVQATNLKEGVEDVISEATQLYDSIAGKIEDLMNMDRSLKKSILREILTGELRFGPDSTATATHVIASNKDGTNTQLQNITNAYVTKLVDMVKMNIILSPANIEERMEVEETDGNTFIDYVRSLTQNMGDQLDTSKLSPDGYSPKSSFSVDGVPEGDLDATPDPFAAMSSDSENAQQQFNSAETNQNLSTMVQSAVAGFNDIFDVMRFFSIGVDSIDLDQVNLTLLNDKKAEKYNIVTVNGKRFRVPVERDTQDIMDDYNYIDDIFREFVLEERKVRDYKDEYKNFHSKPKQRANRVKRVLARRKMEKAGKVKSDEDVNHKNPLRSGGSNEMSNLEAKDKSKNRSDNGHHLGEEHGAGDQGTTELLVKYLKDTPFAKIEGYNLPKKTKKKNCGCGQDPCITYGKQDDKK